MRLRRIALPPVLLGLALSGSLMGSPDDPHPRDGEAVVQRWIESLGGNAAFSKIRALTVEQESSSWRSDSPQREHVVLAGQGKYRIETTRPDGLSQVEAFDGTRGWVQNEALGFGFLSSADLRASFFENNPLLPVLLTHHYSRVNVLGDITVDSVPCHQFIMSAPQADDELWAVEAATGRVRLMEVARVPEHVRIAFDDYRAVGPLTLPFVTSILIGNRQVLVKRLSISLDGPNQPAYFAPSAWDRHAEEEVAQVLRRYLRSLGEPEAFARIHTRVVKAVVDTPATGIKAERVSTAVLPNKILVQTTTKGMGIDLQGYDGTVGWDLSDLQGYHTLKPSDVQALFATLNFQSDRALDSEAPLRRLIGERTVAGRKTTLIALSTLSSPIGLFYFDDENGRLLRYGSTKQHPLSSLPDSTVDYSDFRTVDGLETAFVTTLTTPTIQVITRIESIVNNQPVDETIFEPRPDEAP